MRRATLDPNLRFRVVGRRALLYREGPDPALDRPAHVRAASAMARLDSGRIAIVQDDSLFVAFLEPDGTVSSLTLPPGPEGQRTFDDLRGNKRHKLDLEACFAVGETLFAFGSGSTPARERVLVVDGDRSRIVDAPALYRAFRAAVDFSGSELNIEGATRVGDDVVFANRGNGALRDGRLPVDATCRVSFASLERYLRDPRQPSPALEDVTRYDLGGAAGERLTFTDLAPAPGFGVIYAACAEASPDAVHDGPVSAVVIGVLDETPRHGLVIDDAGLPITDKIEGLLADGDERILAVVDVDDPSRAAQLLELRAEPAIVSSAGRRRP